MYKKEKQECIYKEQFLFEYKQLCKKYRLCLVGNNYESGVIEITTLKNMWAETLDEYIKSIGLNE